MIHHFLTFFHYVLTERSTLCVLQKPRAMRVRLRLNYECTKFMYTSHRSVNPINGIDSGINNILHTQHKTCIIDLTDVELF